MQLRISAIGLRLRNAQAYRECSPLDSTRTFLLTTAPVLALIAGISLAAFFPHPSGAQTLSPYSDFQAMSIAELETLQVKLTYVGVQTAVVPSLAVTSPSQSFDLSAFEPFRRSGVSYFNDTVSIRTFIASVEELKSVIDNVGTLPDITAGDEATNQFLSFAMFNSQPTDKAFEAVIDADDAADLFAQLRLSLTNNKEGLRKLSDLACILNLLEETRPVDVTADITVALFGARLDRHTGLFVGTVRLTNHTAATLAAPISLVVSLEGNVRLVNEDGTTCVTNPVGRELINLSDPLGPGETAQIELQLSNPDRERIRLTTKVLSGPGAR